MMPKMIPYRQTSSQWIWRRGLEGLYDLGVDSSDICPPFNPPGRGEKKAERAQRLTAGR